MLGEILKMKLLWQFLIFSRSEWVNGKQRAALFDQQQLGGVESQGHLQ